MPRWSEPKLVNADYSLPNTITNQSNTRGVYKFSLQGNSIPYPKKDGATLYIGKAKNLYVRIHKHIRNSDRPSLKAYLNSGKRIYVSYKRIEPNKRLNKLESDELKNHTEDFGMIPICNNQNA